MTARYLGEFEIGLNLDSIDRVDVDLEGGFFSNGNDLPGIDFDILVSPLDLFRFENGNIPVDEMEFTNNARVLSPGVASSFSDTLDVFGLSPANSMAMVAKRLTSWAMGFR